MADEKGWADELGGPSPDHVELWLDFAEGMGAPRTMQGHQPVREVQSLTRSFHDVASQGSPAEALAALYAYESQVPRVAKEKAQGLQGMYGADQKTVTYFTLHTSADVHHSQVWKQQLAKQLERDPEAAEKALVAGENAAKALWTALDGIEARRVPPSAAA
jgi:pyrroloquinoline-quinone synthase